MSNYVYSIANDTPNQLVNARSLHDEIIAAQLATQISGVSTAGDVITIAFNAELSTSDESTLGGILGNHEGTASPRDPEEVAITNTISSLPFSAKQLPSGGKLYARVQGVKYSLNTGSNTCNFSIPWPTCKITGIEIIGGELGDSVDLKVLDDSSGTYTTVPNYLLNQFGYTVSVAPTFYSRQSAYDADLFQNMVIEIGYTSASAKDVWINYILHEVK